MLEEGDSQSIGTLDGGETKSIPSIKEVWFAGAHGDMWVLGQYLRFSLELTWADASRGGGNVLNPYLDRTNAPFLWMSYEASLAGLLTELSNAEWKHEHLGDVNESLTGIWKVFEYLPLKHLSYKDSSSTTHWQVVLIIRWWPHTYPSSPGGIVGTVVGYNADKRSMRRLRSLLRTTVPRHFYQSKGTGGFSSITKGRLSSTALKSGRIGWNWIYSMCLQQAQSSRILKIVLWMHVLLCIV
jgi:hypothetical protein